MTAGWTEFAVAFLAFTGSHFLPRIGGLRETLMTRLGRRWYFTAYGAMSLLVLIWLVGAASRAPYVELWPPLPWTRYVPAIAMPIAIFFAVAGIKTPSPFTLGSKRGTVFDPGTPGLAALTRHPLLWALTFWSVSHLPPNGDLAHVLLFGGFAVMSLGAMLIFDQRARHAQSDEATARLFLAAPILSPLALLSPPWLRVNGLPFAKRLLIAAAVWLAALALHLPVIGVSPAVG